MHEDALTKQVRQVDPVDGDLLDAWARSRTAQDVPGRIMGMGSSASFHSHAARTVPRRVAAIALGLASLVAIAAAAVALTSRPTTNPTSVGCYEQLDQNANVAVVAFTSADEQLGPEGICARQWQDAFGEPTPAGLVACIVNGGGTGVFPTSVGTDPEEACGSIGADLPAGGTPYGGLSAAQVRILAGDLEARYAALASSDCAGLTDLTSAFEFALAESGSEAWSVQDLTSPTQRWTFPDGTTRTVQVPLASSGQRCAEYAVNPIGARIVLVNGWPQLPEESQ